MKIFRSPHVLFWAFCFVVFSKIVWYDMRVYVPEGGRRSFMTACFAIWIIGQILVYLPVAKPMFRQINKVVLFWIVAVTPYLALGFVEGRMNSFLIGDIARYALPLGYLLFGTWAVRQVAIRTMLTATITTFAVCFTLRTAMHWILAEKTIRYGINWEVMFPCLLVALALVTKGWRYFALLLALAAMVFLVAFGQTRAVLLGTAIAGVVIGLYALTGLRFKLSSNLRLGFAAVVAVVMALAPMTVPTGTFQRIKLAEIAAETDTGLLAEISQRSELVAEPAEPATLPRSSSREDLETSSERRGTQPEEGDAQPKEGDAQPREGDSARLAVALQHWEKAISAGNRSMDVRITEAYYFLVLMKSDVQSLLLGAGAGDHTTVRTPGSDRIVRGAHNTYITLLYRHGIILGTLLCLFVTFYGLPTNIRQLRSAPSAEWNVLLIGLISYRFAAIGMAQFHQGVFDDPLVFLSMAIAMTPTFHIQREQRSRQG